MDKDKILAEIKRTALLNNGSPLGKLRFEKETGIKESHWIGKHWVKWSEAIIEAGFKPNSMQAAYSKDFLLKAYAELISNLKHIPTNAEVRLRASQDADFPSHGTFTRFGSKRSLLNAVLVYCRLKNEYSGIIELIQDSINSTADQKEKKLFADGDAIVAYVYLIKFGDVYKIGNSNNVERRFRELKTQMPYEGKIIHTITTGDPEGIEKYWHSFFREKRLKGEWFQLSNKDINYFKKRKLM